MFDQLSGRLEKMVKFLRGEGKVTEKNMGEALKMIRLAFLEADVNYKVVRDFEARIKEKALGEEVLSSLSPGPAGHQDRPGRADRHPGRRGQAPDLRLGASVHLHARRPPGQRQDDDLRQAGPLGPGASAGTPCSSPSTSSGRPPRNS